MSMPQIIGSVRDIKPNELGPTLELRFKSDQDLGLLPQEHESEMILDLNGQDLRGLIGIKPSNPPYLRGFVYPPSGEKQRLSDILLDDLGLAENAEILFEVCRVGQLRLLKILTRGSWRQGGLPHERSSCSG